MTRSGASAPDPPPSDSLVGAFRMSSGNDGSCAGASFRASFLASLSSRRSRRRFSRVSFAIVVLCLLLPAMGLHQLDVCGLGSLIASLGLVGNLRALSERAISLTDD